MKAGTKTMELLTLIQCRILLVQNFQILRLKGRFWLPDKPLPLQVQMVGPRMSTWFEKAPEDVWRPEQGGLELVALSLKEGLENEIQLGFNKRFS